MKHSVKLIGEFPRKVSWRALPDGTFCWFKEIFCIVIDFNEDQKFLIGISDTGYWRSDFLVEPVNSGSKIEIIA